MIKLPSGIKDNLQFLCVEVDSQLANMQLYFQQSTPTIANQIRERVGYAYNLKTRIHSSVINQLMSQELDEQTIFGLRSVEFIANDLERITEICRNCISEAESLISFDGLITKHYIKLLKRIQDAVKLIIPAIEHTDSKVAIEIGQINYVLEEEYKKYSKKQYDNLANNQKHSHYNSAIAIAYELKQMGTALVNMCESIISANLGQSVSFDHYFSLQTLMTDIDSDEQNLQIEMVAQTRSGSAISGISSPENGYLGIYKGGRKQKLKEEKQGVQNWHQIYPGLAPKILSYKKKGGTAALLIEHLPGYTFEQIVLNDTPELLVKSQKKLNKILRSLWTETQVDKVINAKFMQQMIKRLPEVYKIHPEFYQGNTSFCGRTILGFDDLVKRAEEQEKKWPTEFSVYIHGDFNIDNIIYDPHTNKINFVDLHRSCYMDYVQDVSTFMVSNYRLQILDSPRRQRIMGAALSMYGVARRYAVKHNDVSFEFRLALGLARSFATSTRFILDKSLAQEMFLRARYLLELVLAIEPEKLSTFRIPLKEIFVE
jgi:aminoglycoside phosphotransferase (APT) family kinase protein